MGDDFHEIARGQLGDSEGTQISVDSFWRSKLPPKHDVEVNTSTLESADAECQVIERAEGGTQTDLADAREEEVSADPVELAGFIDRTLPRMLAELNRKPAGTSKSMALNTGVRTDNTNDAACQHVLSAYSEDIHKNTHGLSATSVSWSCTGTSIAVSYGRFDMEGWCEQPGLLATWNLGMNAEESPAPQHRIETESCLMCCAHHPKNPAIVAGGTYQGQIVLWDLSKEGDFQVGSSTISEFSHREPVIKLIWHYDVSQAHMYINKDLAYILISVGMDGRVLFWKLKEYDEPVYGYQIQAQRVPVGAASLAIQRSVKGGTGTFLVGTEGGKLLRCAMDFTETRSKTWLNRYGGDQSTGLDAKAKAKALTNPVRMTETTSGSAFETHAGPIYSVDYSPHQRDIFLTCGADGTLRLYSMLQTASLLQVEPTDAYLYDAAFSPARPLVFAAAAGDGHVYIYDLQQSTLNPVKALSAMPLGGTAPVYAMAFNKVALAGAEGPETQLATASGEVVKVWRLTTELSDPHDGELGQLKQFVAGSQIQAADDDA